MIAFYVKNNTPYFTGPMPQVYEKNSVWLTSNMAGVTNIKDRDKIVAGLKYHKWVMENPAEFYTAIGTTSPSKKFNEGEEFKKHPYYKYSVPFFKALEVAVPAYQHELSTKLEAAESFNVGLQKVLAGEMDTKEALAGVCREWDEILKEMP